MKTKKNFRNSLVLSALLLAMGTSFATPARCAYGPQQLLPAGHWIYDTLFILNAEQHRASIADRAPLTVAELQLHFSEIDYDTLSPSGKDLYDEAMEFFSEKKFALNMGSIIVAFNVEVRPELLFKSNSDIAWSFATDYTGNGENTKISSLISSRVAAEENEDGIPYNYQTEGNYGSASSIFDNEYTQPVISIPVYIGWGDLFFVEAEPFVGKNYWGFDGWNVTNIPLSGDDFEFLLQRNAYGSFGKNFGDWGVNLNVGKEGIQIGRTLTGSVIYNSTFETQGYVQLNLYSRFLRYDMDIVQLRPNRYMYLHQIEARPWKRVKMAIIEGTLLNEPFEIRYLNPLMIMHSFGSWEDYLDEEEDKYYGESHVCAYMGLQLDVNPCKYLRLYGLYSQNEFQPFSEQHSATGRMLPDSLGIQIGAELTIPEKHGGWWVSALEWVFTAPYLYLKQGSDWSLYNYRYDMSSNGSTPLCSWIGSPFGPDAIGVQAKFGYEKPHKWHAEFDYLYLVHGTNSFGLFDNTVTIDGRTYSAYYPSVLNKMGLLSDSEAEEMARKYGLTGTPQFTNQVSLQGGYYINNHFSVNGRVTYTFIFNNDSIKGNFEQGVELAAYLSYILF